MNQQFRLTPFGPSAGPTAIGGLPFGQRIDLLLDGQLGGTVQWFAPRSAGGIVQILDLLVDTPRRRQGFGTALLRKAYAEATTVFTAAGVKPRRVWVCLEQKRDVVARAFFTKHGYQHVSTLAAMLTNEDGMVYQRTFD